MNMKMIMEFANGNITEDELRTSLNESNITEMNEEEFINECIESCLGIMLQGEYLDESGISVDQSVDELIIETSAYLEGQGIISEATSGISNPKINYVRLNKEAQIKRLEKIIILKLARAAKNRAFDKYKLATAAKKKYMDEMMKTFESRAKNIAKETYRRSMKNGKVAARVKDKATKK